MFKKLISICVILSMCVLKVSASKTDNLSAKCAVVINALTGEVIYSKNADECRPMASTTKIMTALLAIESGKLQSEIVVDENMVKVEGTSMGLLAGDQVSLEELVYGMLLPSGNDAANATAVFLSGSTENFAVKMNERAKEIGMLNTNFVTPSGLDSDGHYSTAYDMALLGREAVKNPKFLAVCSAENATLSYGNPPYLRTVTNHNKLLKRYDYALGIKTGFTKKSGRCLVSYAKKDSAELIAVTLNAPDDWNDHCKLLDYGFEKLKTKTVNADFNCEIPVVGGEYDSAVVTVEPCSYASAKETDADCEVYMDKFVYAPVNSGDVVGRCMYYIDGELCRVEPIVVSESIARK